jgi:hypothetical protein
VPQGTVRLFRPSEKQCAWSACAELRSKSGSAVRFGSQDFTGVCLKDEDPMAVEVITRASAPRTTAGICNIPFVQKDANATSLKATFWIETVQQKNESTFLQLQYTQTVILNFLGIDWPHISIATLIKQ